MNRITSQSWFQDGLTKEEAALVVTLRTAAGSEDVFRDLIQDGHMQSETISLPLAGEVDLFAVGRSELEPGRRARKDVVSPSHRWKDFMGTRWPTSVVTVLHELESDLGSSFLTPGGMTGDHAVVKNTSKNLTYHELAHFYFHDFPHGG